MAEQRPKYAVVTSQLVVAEAARGDRDREGVSIDQFICTSVAEKMSALMAEDYLAARAAQGDREQYLDALAEVPDVEPEAFDK